MNRTVRIAHLVFGLLFLGVAGVWLLYSTEVITTAGLALSGPLLLIAAGVVGLVVSLASVRRGHRPARIGYDDPSATHPPTTSIEDDEHREDHDD
ncbi:MAG TPA: hypothetical protein VFL69_05365 [Marmoricola sp.]|nr:hypothetical protein [Marmoricola sp.]